MLLFNQQFAAKYRNLNALPTPPATPERGETPPQSVIPDPNDMSIPTNRKALQNKAKKLLGELSSQETGDGNTAGFLASVLEKAQDAERAGTEKEKQSASIELNAIIEANLPPETATTTAPTPTKAPASIADDLDTLRHLDTATATALGGPSATADVLNANPMPTMSAPAAPPSALGRLGMREAGGATQPLSERGLASIGNFGDIESATPSNVSPTIPTPTVASLARREEVKDTGDKVNEAEVRDALAYFKSSVAPALSEDKAANETQFTFNNKTYIARRFSDRDQVSYKISAA